VADVITLTDTSTRPRIAWESVLDDADSITSVSTPEDDGAVDQVADWRLYTFWRPTGAGPHIIIVELDGTPTVSGWAIYGHDASGTIGMDTWDGAAWVIHSEVVATGNGAVAYLMGDPVATAKLRFRFATITYLSILWAGVDLVLPEGVKDFEDPLLAQRADVTPEVSREGVFLGAAVEKWDAQLSLDVKNLESTWVRDYWNPFLRTCSTRPFFLNWHWVDWPTSACICTSAKFGKTPFASKDLIDVSVMFMADPGTDGRSSPDDDAPALLTEDPEGPLLLEGT
jgi:hypothetical protein